MWHIYNGILLRCKKITKILTFATIWVDLESITLSELSERKTNTMCYHLLVEPKKSIV